MLKDLEPMLLLVPFIAFLLLLLVYSWTNNNNNNNNNMKEKKELRRDPKELAPAWLMIILHGLSELHAKVALEVDPNSLDIKYPTYSKYLKYIPSKEYIFQKGAPA